MQWFWTKQSFAYFLISENIIKIKIFNFNYVIEIIARAIFEFSFFYFTLSFYNILLMPKFLNSILLPWNGNQCFCFAWNFKKKKRKLTGINNVRVIKKTSKIKKPLILQISFFSLRFIGIIFAGTVFARVRFVVFIMSLHVITELPIMLSAYLPFS